MMSSGLWCMTSHGTVRSLPLHFLWFPSFSFAHSGHGSNDWVQTGMAYFIPRSASSNWSQTETANLCKIEVFFCSFLSHILTITEDSLKYIISGGVSIVKWIYIDGQFESWEVIWSNMFIIFPCFYYFACFEIPSPVVRLNTSSLCI